MRLLVSTAEGEAWPQESCVALNLFTQFLYQRYRHTVAMRRWVLKRLQMELNEIASRTAANKFIKDIQVRIAQLFIQKAKRNVRLFADSRRSSRRSIRAREGNARGAYRNR